MMRAALATGLLALILLAAPVPSYAASKSTFLGPIVPEECHCKDQPSPDGSGTITTAPDYGCVLQVIQNVINFGVTLAIIVFTLYTVIAGFAFITSGGSPQARNNAKTRITNVVVGLAVLLLAWLVVDYVLKVLYNEGTFGPWNGILAASAGDDRCIVATKPSAITSGVIGILSGAPGGEGGVTTAPSGPIPGRICNAASGYRGASTAAGPDGGNKACAWAVNNVLKNAGVKAIGGNAVLGMENALRSGRGQQISQSQAACGDIVIEAGGSHVGICMNSGCTSVLSNSSSKASFSWVSSITFAPSYKSGNGRIYRVTN